MMVYPQQDILEYQFSLETPFRSRGEGIVSITLIYPQQDVIDNLLQIGAPSTPDWSTP